MNLKHIIVAASVIAGLSSINAKADNRWEYGYDKPIIQPTGKVYYYTIESNPRFAKVWRKAIANWAKLNVITFVQVQRNYSGYHVVLTGNYNWEKGFEHSLRSSDDLNGITYYSYINTDGPYSLFSSVEAKLNCPLSTYSFKEQVKAAEHEIGHTLGMAHDNSKVNGQYVIMNEDSVKAKKPLGKYERNELIKYYR